VPSLDAEAFEATLAAGPAAVSFALGEPGELVARAHERAIKVIHQVHAVDQALAAVELGAAGANVGTRFLASAEAGATAAWKDRILAARSEDCVRFEEWGAVLPPQGYDVVPRVIRPAFVEEWHGRFDEAAAQADRLSAEIMGTVSAGRPEGLTPFTGQTAGLISEVLPAAEIVRRMADDVCEALRRGMASCA